MSPTSLRTSLAVLALSTSLCLATGSSAGLFSRNSDQGYPSKDKAIDAVKPAADYSDVFAQRSRAVSIMRARENGFVPSSDLQGYLNGVLGKLVAGVPMPPSFHPDVKVLASPEFEAVCTPDGTVVVTVGLLERLDNEDQLAFILGHEISHAIYRHHGSDWFDKSQYYAVVSGQAVDDMSKQAPQMTQSTGLNMTKFEQGLDVAQHVYKLSSNVLVPQFQQGQEDAADALGFDLMMKAGYSAEAPNAVLEKIAQQEAETKAAADAAKAATQKDDSATNDMKDALQSVASGNITDIFTSDRVIKWFDKAVDSLSDDATTHRPAKDREKLLADYEFREYRHVLPKVPKPLPWNSATFKASRLIDHYRKAEDVASAVASSSISKQTQAAIQDALTPPTSDHAYTGYIASMFYDKKGTAAQSEAALQRAASGPEPSWAVYSRLLNIYIAHGNWQKAEPLMEQAWNRLDSSPVLLPKRIEILHGMGRQQEAEALLPQCKQYDIRVLDEACKKAAGKG